MQRGKNKSLFFLDIVIVGFKLGVKLMAEVFRSEQEDGNRKKADALMGAAAFLNCKHDTFY